MARGARGRCWGRGKVGSVADRAVRCRCNGNGRKFGADGCLPLWRRRSDGVETAAELAACRSLPTSGQCRQRPHAARRPVPGGSAHALAVDRPAQCRLNGSERRFGAEATAALASANHGRRRLQRLDDRLEVSTDRAAAAGGRAPISSISPALDEGDGRIRPRLTAPGARRTAPPRAHRSRALVGDRFDRRRLDGGCSLKLHCK
jgi:hypothetical protein